MVIAYLSTGEENTPAALFKSLVAEYGISRIDVLILNAGTSSFASLLAVGVLFSSSFPFLENRGTRQNNMEWDQKCPLLRNSDFVRNSREKD